MTLIPTAQPTVGRIIKRRSSIQASANTDTKTGTVQSTTVDQNGNVTYADVLIDGQVQAMASVRNDTGIRLTQDARVVVNYVGGVRFLPHIIALAGQNTANAAAAAAAVDAASGSIPPSVTNSGIPYLLTEASPGAPGGYVEDPGANVMFEDTAPRVSDSGGVRVPGERIISAKPLVMLSLPDPSTTLLADGTCVDLIAIGSDGFIVPAGMYRLDTTLHEWIRRDGGAATGGGVQTVNSLPPASSVNYGNLYLLHTAGIKDSLWVSMLDASGTNQLANIALGRYKPTFDPLTDVAGCCLWLAADALMGLSNGDPVTSWTDASPSGLLFTNGSATAPDYIASAYSGLPCVRNTGGGNKLLYTLGTPTGLTGASGATTFLVMKQGGVSGAYYVPITVGSNGYIGNNGYIPYVHAPDVLFQHSGVGTLTFPGTAPSSSNIFQYTFLDNAGSSTVSSYINSVLIGSGSIGPMNNPASITTLFGDVPTATDAQLDLCEVLIYTGVLSGTDRAKVENYLQGKWGII